MARVWRPGALLVCVVACAAGFAVDCDRDYADCEKDTSKLSEDDDFTSSPALQPKTSENVTRDLQFSDVSPKSAKARLLNLSVDDLANMLHKKENKVDLSDVSLDDEDFEFPHETRAQDARIVNKPVTALPPLEARDSLQKITEYGATCTENEVRYKPGEKIERACEESCECADGVWRCAPRCQSPYVRRGRRAPESLCYESPVDDCCSIITCTSTDGELKASSSSASTENVRACVHGNKTYKAGQSWEVGCEQRCTCGPYASVVCKPRCETLAPSEHCINVQDPHDACCQVQVCDVTHDAHEHDDAPPPIQTTMEDRMDRDLEDLVVATTSKLPVAQIVTNIVTNVRVLANNSVLLTLSRANSSEQPLHIQISSDNGHTYSDIALNNANMIENLKAGDYMLRVNETGKNFVFRIEGNEENTIPTTTKKQEMTTTEKIVNETTKVGCVSEGVMYGIGEEFRIGCSELCECIGPNEKECATLDCPSHVGLELVSPSCVRWAPDPPDWVPVPPACCPTKMRCLSDGSCDYQGHKIPNWSEVPESLTGCELRCFCESGTLDCQNICSPLPPLPPQTLRCQPGFKPGAVNISDEDCCKQWGCLPLGPSGVTMPPGKQQTAFLPTVPPEIHFPTEDDLGEYGQNNDIHRQAGPPPNAPPPFQIPGILPSPGVEPVDNKKLNLRSLVSDTPNSVKMLFELSPVLVGLRGSVDLRYTDKDDEDISTWYSQVFAPADEILTTARLEFRLTGLKPSTVYKIQGKLFLHNLPLEPISSVYTVRTLDLPPVVEMEEKRRAVEGGLRLQNVNSTAAAVSWRHFTEEELQYIDGIQVRYRPVEQPIYSMTELLHHWRVSVELGDLRPGTLYEASLVLVPPPRSAVELYDPKTINFTTPHYYDMYNFSVTVEARRVGSDSVEVTWRGVPAPPERYVRVYRAAHSCDGDIAAQHAQRERDAFKLADRDQPPVILLAGLRSDSKCRVWLELFLTNGKVKISNVLDVATRQEDGDNNVDNEVQASSVAGSRSGHNDYYSALVVVGVVAALGTLTSLLLLLVVMRRHRPHSVSITTVPSGPRGTSLPPYDNPAYKLELQQETMDL